MMRAGQPLTGTNGRRCKEDEKLINATLRPGKRGYIIDTRTISVAQQAKARGGGFESEANYPQWRRIHKAIERCVTTEAERFALHFCPQRVDAVAVSAPHVVPKIILKKFGITGLFPGLMSSRRVWSSLWRRVMTGHTTWTAGWANWRPQAGRVMSRRSWPPPASLPSASTGQQGNMLIGPVDTWNGVEKNPVWRTGFVLF